MERRLFFLGDIHGNFNIIKQYIKTYDIENADIIQVGDFGLGFKTFEKDKNNLTLLNDFIKKHNISLYAIRGNHDHKLYFDEDPFGLSNIKLLKDYSVLNLNNHNILCVGGAVSIDRVYRIINDKKANDGIKSWWPDESFSFDKSKTDKLSNIDVIVTHTTPEYCPPDNSNGFGHLVNSMAVNDEYLKTDLLTERKLVSDLFENLSNNNIKYHYYGHFHNSRVLERNGIIHRMLDINELWEDKNDYDFYGK